MGGLQSSCRNISRMISGNRMDMSSISSVVAKDVNTYIYRFDLFTKHCCNAIRGNEEQNPLAVMKWPEDCLLLLKQLKKFIEDKLPGFDIRNILPHIHQDLIYKSPGALQRMVVARYSIWLQTENRNVLKQNTSRSQMLVWDHCVPPHQRLKSSGDWHIVTMEVVIDKIDVGGGRLDNKNPMVHLKIFLHIAHGRMNWPPKAANNIDPDFSTCNINFPTYNNVFNRHASNNVLRPEEWRELLTRKWLEKTACLKEQVANWMERAKQYCQRLVSGSHFSWTSLAGTADVSPCLPKGKASIDPAQLINYGSIHGNRQGLITNGRAMNSPPAINVGSGRKKQYKGRSGASSLQAWQVLLLAFTMLQPAGALRSPTQPDGHHVILKSFRDSNNSLNCSLQTGHERFLCYGEKDAVQCKSINSSSVEDLLKRFCEQQKKDLDANLLSLNTNRNLTSGSLQLNLSWELEKQNWTVINVTVEYLFNGEVLPKKNISILPKAISSAQEDLNIDPSEFMVKLQSHVKNLWEKFKDELLPFLNSSGTPETATSLSTGTTVLIIVLPVCIVIIIGVGYCHKKTLGKTLYKGVRNTFSKLTFRRAAQTEPEPEGDPNGMEAPEREELVIPSV